MYSLKPLDAGCLAAADLGVDLGDVEDVDVDAVVPEQRPATHASAALVVVAGDDLRRVVAKLGDALKPRQQNSWANRGSGRSPSRWYNAIFTPRSVWNPYAFLMVSFAL